MAFLVGGANSASGGYEISNSCRFDGTSSYMSITPGSAGNRRTFTISCWLKVQPESSSRAIISTGADSGSNDYVYFTSADKIKFSFATESSGDVMFAPVFRDPAAWYHFVFAVDTTQGTAANRVKGYQNGVQMTVTNDSYPDQNYDTAFNNTVVQRIGGRSYSVTQYYDGYMADFILVDGSQLTPSSFGETNNNGVWIPKEADVTYGTNGFKLEFKQTGTSQNSSGIGADTSGNDNHLAVTNLAATDQTTDTPSNNFATMNPLIKSTTGSSNLPTYSEGNCLVTNHDDGDCSTLSTIGVANGRWYFEAKFEKATTDVQGYPQLGWAKHGNDNDGGHVGFHTPDGSNYRGKVDATVIANAFDGVPAANDIIGFYLDVDNGTLIVHQNGSDFMGSGASSGLDFSSTTFDPDTGFFHAKYNSNSNVDHSIQFNFGNPTWSLSSAVSDANGYGNFEYSPTLSGTDYYALCTKNLAEHG